MDDDTPPTRPLLRLLGLSGVGAALASWWWRRRCCTAGRLDWPDSPAWSTDGVMTNVGSFTAFVDANRPCYRHYPEASAQAVLGMDPSGSHPQPAFELAYHPGAGSGETDVVVTRDVEGDDSVAGERVTLTFLDEAVTGGTAGVHRLVFGQREVRCHAGRGHEDWSTTPCL